MAKKKKNKDSDGSIVDSYKKAINEVHTQLGPERDNVLPVTDNMPIRNEDLITDFEAVIQESNRIFFHPLGLDIRVVSGNIVLVNPSEQPKLNYGANVKEEIANVKSVQEMRIVNCKKRLKELGYKVQPVNTNF